VYTSSGSGDRSRSGSAEATASPFGRDSPASPEGARPHPAPGEHRVQRPGRARGEQRLRVRHRPHHRVGSGPHSRTSAVPAAGPCSRAPTAYIPQAATVAAAQDTSCLAAPPLSGATSVTAGVTADVRAPKRPDKRMVGGERDAAGCSA
jgi:hypothetical protein